MSEQTHPDVANVDCTTCKHIHTNTWPHVCRDRDCVCDNDIFLRQLKDTRVRDLSTELTSVKAKTKLLLEEYPDLQNVSAKHFIFAYWSRINDVDLTIMDQVDDPEVIARMRRETVEKYPALGPDAFIKRKKIQKEEAMRSYFGERK